MCYQVKADVLLGNVSLSSHKNNENHRSVFLNQHFQAGPDVVRVTIFSYLFFLFVLHQILSLKEDKWEHLNLSRPSSHTKTNQKKWLLRRTN